MSENQEQKAISLKFNTPQVAEAASYLASIISKSFERLAQRSDLENLWRNPGFFYAVALAGASRQRTTLTPMTLSENIVHAFATGKVCQLLPVDLLRLLNATLCVLRELMDEKLRTAIEKELEREVRIGFDMSGGKKNN